MRKNINKLVAFAIGISVMSGSVMPAFAADAAQASTTITNTQTQANGKPLLTLDDAVQAGILNDSQLLMLSKKINLQEDTLDLFDESNTSGYTYDNQELIVKQLKQQKDFREDTVAQNITDSYNDLVEQSMSLEKLKKQIQIKTKDINNSQLKMNLGLMTSTDLTQAQISLQTLKNNEIDAENKLKNSQDYFGVLINKDLGKYSLAQDTDYEVFKIDGSVDEYLDNEMDNYLEYTKESNNLYRDHVKNDIGTVADPGDVPELGQFNDIHNTDGSVTTKESQYQAALTQYNQNTRNYTEYLSDKVNLAQKQSDLSDSKKTLKNGLNVCYTNLIGLENKIAVMKSQMELDNKTLSNMKLKLDLGLITKTDYDNQDLNNLGEEITLRTLIDSYNKLKNNIQKPWVLIGSGSSASASNGSSASGSGSN